MVDSYCLAGCLLTGKYSRPGGTGRHGPQRIEKLRQRGVLDQVDGCARLAAEHGATAAQLAEDLGSLAVAGRLGPAISRLEADTGQPADRHRD